MEEEEENRALTHYIRASAMKMTKKMSSLVAGAPSVRLEGGMPDLRDIRGNGNLGNGKNKKRRETNQCRPLRTKHKTNSHAHSSSPPPASDSPLNSILEPEFVSLQGLFPQAYRRARHRNFRHYAYEPCPSNGQCYEGNLKCDRGYRKYGKLCIEDGDVNEIAKKLMGLQNLIHPGILIF
ncbi:hypothetical protein FNV43_RR10217 [Rhamnella rubrinervis]|uniref:Uncharacterized protein n=1 Tax=Rhamnella rubrinervis TaxID=2594499 RepID=A0A8K0HCR8_9ROSA|nr:hypothetical protein FNV43_RR10217 [Rhamnella rubrinervis]